MNKRDIIAFFDRHASRWDERMVTDDRKIAAILDAGRADHVSRKLPQPEELADLFSPWFQVETALADEEKYIVSGKRR